MMISSSSMMDWEPAEDYGMDVDEIDPVDVPMYMAQLEDTFSSLTLADCDVYMAPITVEEVHMASPILTSQPPTVSEIDFSTFFLSPLEMKTKPIVFPPFNIPAFNIPAFNIPAFNIPAVSRQTLGFRVSPITAVPLDDSSFIYIPAYQAETPTMASASFRGDTYTSAVHHFPSKSAYLPFTPLPLKSRTTLRDVAPILMPMDVFEEDGQIGDTRAASLNPLFESTSPAVPLDDSSFIYMPAYQAESPTIASASFRGDTYTSAVHHFPSNSAYLPFTPLSLKSRTTLRDVAPILMPMDVLEEDGQIDDTRAASLSPVIESTTPAGWPDWIDEQDVTPSTPCPVVAETNTFEWTVDEDATALSQYPILDPFHWPEITIFQEYLIDLSSPNFDSPNSDIPNSDKDDFVLRAFGGSSSEDLDWILEGFRATSIADACIETKNASNSFEAMFVPTKTDASTQTEELPGASYSLRPPRRYSPSVRYSPYRRLSRNFTFGSSGSGDSESAQPTITITAVEKDNVLLECSSIQAIISERELEARPAVRVNSRELEDDDEEKKMTTCSMGSAPENVVYALDEPTNLPAGHGELEARPVVRVNSREPEDDDQEKEMSFPGAYPIQQVVYGLDEPTKLPAGHGELEARPVVRVNSGEPEDDDQEKEMTFPGAYPIQQVVYGLDEPTKLPARHFVEEHFETEALPCPTVQPSAQYGFKESFFFRIFAYFFDW